MSTYLTTEELASRIKYDSRTIRNQLKDAVFIEGVHYIRPFQGRKILYICQVFYAKKMGESRKIKLIKESNHRLLRVSVRTHYEQGGL